MMKAKQKSCTGWTAHGAPTPCGGKVLVGEQWCSSCQRSLETHARSNSRNDSYSKPKGLHQPTALDLGYAGQRKVD